VSRAAALCARCRGATVDGLRLVANLCIASVSSDCSWADSSLDFACTADALREEPIHSSSADFVTWISAGIELALDVSSRLTTNLCNVTDCWAW